MHDNKVICKVKQTQQWKPMFAQFIGCNSKRKQMNLLNITTKGVLVHQVISMDLSEFIGPNEQDLVGM
jgi:hypothetical protein